MSVYDPFGGLWGDAHRPRVAGRHVAPFSLVIADLSLPAAGGDPTEIDTFIMVAHDVSSEKLYLDFVEVSGATGQNNGGTMVFEVYQSLADGKTRTIYAQRSVDALPTAPLDLGAAVATLKPGRSVFLRITATPLATDPWWDSGVISHINGTFHLLSTP